MERSGLDVDSNGDSFTESLHSYGKYLPTCNAPFGVMYNLFKPGSSFHLNLIDSDSCSSSDPIRADCSLNDGVIANDLCSPKQDFFVDPPTKRTSVHIQIDDDLCELNNYTTNHASLIEPSVFQQSVPGFIPHVSQSFELKESYCNVDLLGGNNIPDDNSIHNDFANPIEHLAGDEQLDKDHTDLFYSNEKPREKNVQKETNASEILDSNKSSLNNLFLTMENSNNAIDNNLHANVSVDQSPSICSINCNSNNHIFKLPNNELTFNGTLKHLQKLPDDNELKYPKDLNNEFKYNINNDGHKDESTEYYPYKSSDDVTSNSPSVSVYSSKSSVTVFSSTSQFPSDCDATSQGSPLKDTALKDSNNILNSVTSVSNGDVEKKLTFTGTVRPLKTVKHAISPNRLSTNTSHCKNGESLDHSYNSGAQSPNIFSDDEDDYNEQRIRAEKTQEIFKQFDKCDTLLIKNLEKTLQGVLPPPSVTICQLTVNEIINRYHENLSRFNNSQKRDKEPIYDPEASGSMTPPRQINSESTIEPSLSNSLAMAFETTVTHTFDQSATSDQLNDTLTANVPNKDATSNGILFINGTEDIAINEKWPQILQHRYYGMYYNSNQNSETIDCLLSRYTSRYVGCETASSCVSIPMTVGSGYRGLVRRPQHGAPGAPSPSRRLSHLARRRAAFCTAATLAAPTTSGRRQILIDRNFFPHRKFSTTSRTRKTPSKRTPGRKTPGKKTPGKKTPGKKTPAKRTPGKKTPSSSQKKFVARKLGILSEQRVKVQPTRETSKRALFLSPENVQSKSATVQDNAKASTSRAIRSKRALFGSPAKNNSETDNSSMTKSEPKVAGSFSRTIGFYTDVGRKRHRMDEDDKDFTPTSKIQKSLSFGGDNIGCSSSNDQNRTLTRRATEYFTSNNELSDIHKKKLLWAVAEALRQHGIGMSHESFKQHATSLVRLTRKLCTLPAHMRALKTPFSSTSDTLLKIARLHVFSVIKGRSVDELFLEEQIKQMNASSAKVTGYVSLNAYQASRGQTVSALNKNSENSYGEVKVFKPDSVSSGKKTVLQDKTVNIETKSNSSSNAPLDLELKKPASHRDNNKLRARRQISFDHLEDSSTR